MAEEMKRISVNAIERMIKQEEADMYKRVQFHGETMFIKRSLSLDEALAFIGGIADSVFMDDGTYVPEAKEFTLRCAILEMYANFRLPENVKNKYDMVYSDVIYDAIDMIMSNINTEQYDDMCEAIDKRIAYRIKTNVQAVERKIAGLMQGLEELEDQMRGVFGGMTQEEAAALVGTLARGVDEEKIVNALVEAKYVGGAVDPAGSEASEAGESE